LVPGHPGFRQRQPPRWRHTAEIPKTSSKGKCPWNSERSEKNIWIT
jgi:hypothetical protein